MKDKFIQFLKDQGVYDKYMNSLDEPFEATTSQFDPDMFIRAAFIWKKTPEGEGYWRGINIEWLKVV